MGEAQLISRLRAVVIGFEAEQVAAALFTPEVEADLAAADRVAASRLPFTGRGRHERGVLQHAAGWVRFYRFAHLASADLDGLDELLPAMLLLTPVAHNPGAIPPPMEVLIGPGTQPGELIRLASALSARADPGSLAAAAGLLAQARDLAPESDDLADADPTSPGDLTNLGLALRTRGELLEDEAACDEAIEAFTAALAAWGPGSRAAGVANLGLAHLSRYRVSGRRADLDPADTHLAAAAEQFADPAARAQVLGDRADVQRAMFESGAPARHLDRSIELARAALRVVPGDGARFAAAASLRLRYSGAGDPADLDEALAVAGPAADDPATLNLRASLFELRFVRDEDPADRDAAIGCYERALALTPAGDHNRPELLSGLAGMLSIDLRPVPAGPDRVADLLAEAVATASDPRRAGYQFNLGWYLYSRRWNVTSDPGDLDRAIDWMARSLPGPATGRTSREAGLARAVAARWRRTASSRDRDLLRKLVAEAALPEGADPVQAADYLQELGTAALDVGETAAALNLLGQAVALLPGILPATGDQAVSEMRLTGAAGLASAVAEAYCAAGDPAGALAGVEAARAQLLSKRVPPAPLVGPAGADEALVLLSAWHGHGRAVVFTATGDPVILTLPGLRTREVERHVGALTTDEALPGILEWLWTEAVAPVLEVVRDRTGSELPRVWWTPCGLLSLLPLHAAQPPGGPGCLDAAVSSYAHTVRLVEQAPGAGRPERPGLLGVAVPEALGAEPLAHAGREIDDLTTRRPETRTLSNPTRAQFAAALPGTTWLHFAGHASLDERSPGAGALCLADGPFTVSRIVDADLGPADLAFLSACSTGGRGWRHADEAMHLASAFHVAGFRHVVSSLWTVSDAAARSIADSFNAALTTPDDAPAALREATLALRRRAPGRPHLWAPFIHSGP